MDAPLYSSRSRLLIGAVGPELLLSNAEDTGLLDLGGATDWRRLLADDGCGRRETEGTSHLLTAPSCGGSTSEAFLAAIDLRRASFSADFGDTLPVVG